jgi:hypothetical protein
LRNALVHQRHVRVEPMTDPEKQRRASQEGHGEEPDLKRTATREGAAG